MYLTPPDVSFRDSFLAALDEWNHEYQPGSGIRDVDALHEADGFARWVDALDAEQFVPSQPGYVCCSYYWIVDTDEVVGCIALRHELNDHLRKQGGHVGYAVRPSRRGHGYAKQALSQIREIARERGIERLLLTCDETNIASRRVIESCGGVLEDVYVDEEGHRTLRFLVATA